jgi:hypothetical protein
MINKNKILIKQCEDFLKSYRSIYMETQIHPSIIHEALIMQKARELSKAFRRK